MLMRPRLSTARDYDRPRRSTTWLDPLDALREELLLFVRVEKREQFRQATSTGSDFTGVRHRPSPLGDRRINADAQYIGCFRSLT